MYKNQLDKFVNAILIACAVLSTYCFVEINRSLDRMEQTIQGYEYFPPEYEEDL